MNFADTATALNLTNTQLLELLQNPAFTALTSNPTGLIDDMVFDDTAVAAFASTMAAVAAAGWAIDYNTQLSSANFTALASSIPGPRYLPAVDPLADQLDAL